jgi:FtsP/CotA-like multicopper oxidase with cupredoxin domain
MNVEAVGVVLAVSLALGTAPAHSAQAPLDSKTIPKYVTELAVPRAYTPTVVTDPVTGNVVSHDYTVDVTQFTQQVLPVGFPQTTVWGYGGNVTNPDGSSSYLRATPGATFEAVRGVPVNVQWVNNLVDANTGAPLTHMFPIDPTLHWANPNMMAAPLPPFLAPPGYPDAQSPVPIVPHLHGAEVESASDGSPEAWWTPGEVLRGRHFVKSRYSYANRQAPTTLWYHDHALGLTRQNVYAGLAGFYLLRDPADANSAVLPSGKYEIPLVIQDRMFFTDGSLNFPSNGINPNDHPYWTPEFFGDTIVVNGQAWPNLSVERRAYRLRLLNGSNARFYTLKLSNKQSFTQVTSDGGYLPAPVTLSELTIAPGERADIIVDFSRVKAGSKIVMTNSARAPFPAGAPADPQTVGQIMQFTVLNTPAVTPPALPPTLNTIAKLSTNVTVRTRTLNEVMGAAGPLQVLLDGQMWDAPVSEMPRVGSTEIWEIVNLTADTHPIHLHLVQFQLLNRQTLQTGAYTTAWNTLNGGGMLPLMQPTVALSPANYLQGKPMGPAANEMGWKDTLQVRPGEVTRLLVRVAPTEANVATTMPGMNLFPFDPTVGPGYVWHCHILDHEDNEMMRPMSIMP